MAERIHDAKRTWTYLFRTPNADLQNNRAQVEFPNLVESQGTDGRFLGSIRPFPGFVGQTDHGLLTPKCWAAMCPGVPYSAADVSTYGESSVVHGGQALSSILLAEYVSLQKGNGDAAIRGVAFLAKNWGDCVYGDFASITAGTNTATLDATYAPATEAEALNKLIDVIDGSGSGQQRTITAYNPSTKVITVSSNWSAGVTNGDTYRIRTDPNNNYAVYLSYWDTDEAAPFLVMLEDLADFSSIRNGEDEDAHDSSNNSVDANAQQLLDYVPGLGHDPTYYSLSAGGRYIYLTLRYLGSEVTAADKARPVNRAYFWDFPYADGPNPQWGLGGEDDRDLTAAATTNAYTVAAVIPSVDSTDDATALRGHLLRVVNGPAAGQTRQILSAGYSGGTTSIRVVPDFDPAPNAPRSTITLSTGTPWKARNMGAGIVAYPQPAARISGTGTIYGTVSPQSGGTGDQFQPADGIVSVAVQFNSRKHGLRSGLVTGTADFTALSAGNYTLRITLGGTSMVQRPGYNPYYFNWGVTFPGLQEFDSITVYRTLGTGVPDDATPSEFEIVGTLFEEIPIKKATLGTAANIDTPWTTPPSSITVDLGEALPTAADYDGTPGGPPTSPVTDVALGGSLRAFDPVRDIVPGCPPAKLVHCQEGITFLVQSSIQGGATGANGERPAQTYEYEKEIIRWSSLEKGERETFPISNYYVLKVAGEDVLTFEEAGDYVFLVTNSSIYRLARNGTSMLVNRVQGKLGGVSRYGAKGVGNSLYVVTPSGLKEINGNTGDARSVAAVDRVIFDNNKWAQSLASVIVDYDGLLGALILHNTSMQEAIFLWEATGAVTTLSKAPWTRLISGLEAKGGNGHRAYWLTSAGVIHAGDYSRVGAKRALCGALSGETVNGEASSAHATNLTIASGTFPTLCVGFYVHWLSGSNKGTQSLITARNSATSLTVEAPGTAIAEDDRFSIAPVLTRVILPQVSDGEPDVFTRKVVTSVVPSLYGLAGEVTANDVNAIFTVGVLDRGGSVLAQDDEGRLNVVPDKAYGLTRAQGLQLYPFFRSESANVDFELQALQVTGIMSSSQRESPSPTGG